jgi:benzoyl-CoA reductase subunit C
MSDAGTSAGGGEHREAWRERLPGAPAEPVLPDWEGLPLEAVLERARELVDDPEYPTVRTWRERGGKVLGHFQVYFPEELAHAAGVLPVKVSGAQVDGVEAESHFGSYLCSIVKTSLELALSRKLALDLFVTHPICDAARNLAAIWGRNFPYKCQILYLPQNANSAGATEWLRHEYGRLLRDIEAVAGRRVGDDDLRRSIAVYNEGRRHLRELYEIKRTAPWRVAAEDAYALVALAGILPREEHNTLMRQVLPQLRARGGRGQDRMRVVLEGGFCEQPPLDFLEVIGRSCYLVDDDLLIGLRYLVEDVPFEGDPLQALAESYLERSSYSPVQHDLRKPKEAMLLERVRRAGAQAVILAAAKMCEPGLEEIVGYCKALDAEGIPYFVTEFEENQTTFDHLSLQLETFVENVLFQ